VKELIGSIRGIGELIGRRVEHWSLLDSKDSAPTVLVLRQWMVECDHSRDE
jgi:hypothetical protein